MSDLAAFLEARADEDEAAIPGMELLWGETAADNDLEERRVRARREVEVKRALITLYREAWAVIGQGTVAVMAAAVVRRDTLHRVLATLAAVYRDHPDYRPD